MLQLRSSRVNVSARSPPCHGLRRTLPLASVGRPSIDPMIRGYVATAAPGTVYSLSSPAEVEAALKDQKDKLVIIMCKASHCKPCKTFMTTYNRLAQKLPNSVLLDIMGDASPETKKLMVEWGVKSTPTFRMYRNGEFLGLVTGAKPAKVVPAITEHLRDGEPGKGLTPEDLEESAEDDDE